MPHPMKPKPQLSARGFAWELLKIVGIGGLETKRFNALVEAIELRDENGDPQSLKIGGTAN